MKLPKETFSNSFTNLKLPLAAKSHLMRKATITLILILWLVNLSEAQDSIQYLELEELQG